MCVTFSVVCAWLAWMRPEAPHRIRPSPLKSRCAPPQSGKKSARLVPAESIITDNLSPFTVIASEAVAEPRNLKSRESNRHRRTDARRFLHSLRSVEMAGDGACSLGMAGDGTRLLGMTGDVHCHPEHSLSLSFRAGYMATAYQFGRRYPLHVISSAHRVPRHFDRTKRVEKSSD